jgi:hypothetical protein
VASLGVCEGAAPAGPELISTSTSSQTTSFFSFRPMADTTPAIPKPLHRAFNFNRKSLRLIADPACSLRFSLMSSSPKSDSVGHVGEQETKALHHVSIIMPSRPICEKSIVAFCIIRSYFSKHCGDTVL